MSENIAPTEIPQEVMKKLPRTVKAELPTLPTDSQKKFLETYLAKRKRLFIAYPLVLVYGTHFIYLEQSSTGIWFWFTAGFFGIWWLIELFKVPGRVKDYNSYLALKTVAEVRPYEDKPKF